MALSSSAKAIERLHKFARMLVGPSYRPNTMIGALYHFINRSKKFLFWNVVTLSSFFPFAVEKKRLLVIYDTSSQPLSIGDLIIFQAGALALLAEKGLKKVDFLIIYDPASPVSSDKTYSHINTENVFYYLSSVLPISQINQGLGSLMVLDSKQLLSKFIVDNLDYYDIWPSAWKYASKDYLYYDMLDKVLYEHYKKTGENIYLKSRPFLTEWAYDYFKNETNSAIPVTVNLRNNKSYQQHRNANLDAWLSFFKDCESKYPVKFIIICAQNERDERFRALENVIFSKDSAAGIDQELALIENSAIHMGVGSGPISMAWFGKKPYLMVNTNYPSGYFKNKDMLVTVDKNTSRFCFGTNLQRISADIETAEFLIEQFAIMMNSVDIKKWREEFNIDCKTKKDVVSTWLR